VENLSDAFSSARAARILATNVYEKQGDAWYIVHHHASPVMRPTPTFAEPDTELLN
jgi:ketosteroid isomerase-like protein